MKKKILILGSSGFIGANFNNFYKKSIRFKKKYILINSHNLKERKFNFFSKISLNKFIEKHQPDFILNFTGQKKNNIKYQKKIFEANKNLIKICNKKNIKIFLASSDHVNNKFNIIRKNSEKFFSYSIFKHKIEKIYLKYAKNFMIIRVSNIYDKDLEKKGLLKNIKNSILKGKKIIFNNMNIYRNFIYIEDVIRIFSILIIKEKSINKTIIYLSNQNIKLADILKYFKQNTLKCIKFLDLKLKDEKSIKISNSYIVKNLKYKYISTLPKIIKKQFQSE